MSAESVEATQKVLGQIVKKTPLTEKLLSRPPFRYLHDLTMEILKVTDFAPGLFSDKEQDSANVTDKDAKLDFLQKLVDCVAKESGQKIKAKPSRIVAGLDADDTNTFLQVFAQTAMSSPKKIEKKSTSGSKKMLSKEKSTPNIAGKAKKPTKQGSTVSSSKDDLRKLPELATKSQDLKTGPPPPSTEPITLTARPTTSAGRKPAAPTTTSSTPAPTVILDSNTQTKEEENTFVVLPAFSTPTTQTSSLTPHEHGGLVKTILETNASLGGSKSDQTTTQDSKDKQSIQKEVDELRQFVQAVAKKTAPLSQLLDFFQEDMDSMVKEMDHWKSDYAKAMKQLEGERKKTENLMTPLKAQLLQADEHIDEAVSRVNEVKAKIAENEDIIQKLLGNIVGTVEII